MLRVLKSGHADNLLTNGDFESARNETVQGWTAAPNGLFPAPGEGRAGSTAIRCRNTTERGWVGASQTLTLNRVAAAPLIVRGWSKADAIDGGPDSNYSLYVDLQYIDGTPLWGQTANFRTGTHDWEQKELLIIPEKPVRSVTVHCLLRNHTGTAWFDDIALEEVKAADGAVVFQGVPVAPSSAKSPKDGKRLDLRSADGLQLEFRGDAVSSLKVGGQELAGAASSGFFARDVAVGSDFFAFGEGHCPELGLGLQVNWSARSDAVMVEGRLSDVTGKDRAISLVFALPLDATGWRWDDDIRRSRLVDNHSEYANVVSVRCGATGTLSLYPFAALSSKHAGLGLGIDMAKPAQYRLAYHAGTRQFFVAWDFGLVPETRNFPSAADFRFVLFRFDPEWGFRNALQKYIELFPKYFEVRSKDQGIWMPFTDVSTVKGWEDFGFKYHEGNNNVRWDDTHGILSFRYTEPMTWWMRMSKETPRSLPEALRARDQIATAANDPHQRDMALVSRFASMWDDTGEPHLLFRNEPWCNGAVWSLNPNPALPGVGEDPGTTTNRQGRLNAATLYWNEAIKQNLYGPQAKGALDGEYLDSIEGYVTADLNFRREHFRWSTVPLTFASDTKRPALYKGLAVFEFTKWLSDDVHRLNKLMFANGVPYRFSFLCPWLDVLGTETGWLRAGNYHPASDTQMSFWRAMSGAKPYLLLMNTDYDKFDSGMVERYFQRALFYGMFPSMFSHNAAENPYWQNPKWYERDRPLFKKYQPLMKRVAEAGWQPVTLARCDNEQLFIERFGPNPGGSVYFTVHNETGSVQRGFLRFDAARLGELGNKQMRELLSNAQTELRDGGCDIALEPQQTKLLELRTSNR